LDVQQQHINAQERQQEKKNSKVLYIVTSGSKHSDFR
jgi:hypothetical protein